MSDLQCYVLKWRNDGEYLTNNAWGATQGYWSPRQREAYRFTKAEAIEVRKTWLVGLVRLVRLVTK